MKLIRCLLISYCCLFFHVANAQDDKIVKSVSLDPMIIEAFKTELNINSFIQIQKSDTTLHNAFRMLRKGNYKMDSRLVIFDREAEEKVVLDRRSIHLCDSLNRGVIMLDEKIEGKLKDKKGNYKYYTAVLFEKAFFPEVEKTNPNSSFSKKDGKRSTSDYDKLKDLVFSPGAAIELPFIGKRLAIFEDDMIKYYDYSIRPELLSDSINCYVFTCNAKVDGKGKTDDKPIVKSFETWFRKGSYEVLRRKTNYTYHGLLADLDIDITIDLLPYHNKAIPAQVTYSGYWDIPGRKSEIVWFRLAVKEYSDCNP